MYNYPQSGTICQLKTIAAGEISQPQFALQQQIML